MAITMNAKDSIAAPLAECFVTIDDKRYNFMQAINLEATITKNKVEVPILGQTGRGHKSTSWTGTGSANFHFNSSIFGKLMERYKDTGEDMYFDMQIKNDDPTTAVGSQIIILRGCNLDGGTLTKFDADAEYLESNIVFTFEDYTVVRPYDNLNGML